ncbi:ABC transporter substrate-binding protein [Elstera cyanobacteriorum]|uniref:Solute-binding protein family 5 domain-containing protein n=1 Tax=Elstera cyanobacteriorum TaxID=2022747 RepID=A0A255XMN6_9PROT|nr:extracellular solute-binding protein [Elstera cyanobacteriorum]OYQ17530.1 hypothetical protein CHR90_16440 [Elstera cyanobacteriorum]GFZ94644.1 ABC transporter substrate-binding protein [Elstera cyanobacteriorum]
MTRTTRAIALAASLCACLSAGLAAAEPVHGIALYGEPKYKPGFSHFDYVNPNAPKGGEVRQAVLGGFDSLNPFILKGNAAAGLALLFDTLTIASDDEPFTRYGLLAETMEIAADRASITFTLRADAKFHDGSPVTVQDVAFSYKMLKEKGSPHYRSYFGDVTAVETPDARTITFRFKDGTNRELPLIIGEFPVFSAGYYANRPFDQTSLDAPLGSGPYKVKAVDANRSITYQRDPNYWAKDLGPQKGHHNFDTLRYDYYRDDGVALEALMAGDLTLRQETSSSRWATAYDKPPVRQGLIQRTEIGDSSPRGMQGWVYNTRRPIFADRRVRAALAYAFDFEWTNKTLSDGKLIRTASYFDNSELRARGLPQGDELALLEPFRGKVPDEVFTQEYLPPQTDGSGNIRDNLRTALRMLREAGWTVKDNKLVNAEGKPLTFEILIDNQAFERTTLPFIKNLEQLGVTATLRLLDVAQYQKRIEAYDFDMMIGIFPQSISPGNEQRDFFGAHAADIPGGRNLAGIKDPAIDALIEQVIYAPSRAALVTRTRALDRLLRWGHYVIPQFHGRTTRYAHWDFYGRTGVETLQRESFDRWWWDAEKAAATQAKKGK